MSHYQGHHKDGSGVQAHSAGGLYPYVVYAQGADELTYGVIVPGQAGYLVGTYDEAVEHAVALKGRTTVRTNGQNFKTGQVVRVSGHGFCDARARVHQLHAATHRALVKRFGGLHAVWVPLTSLAVSAE